MTGHDFYFYEFSSLTMCFLITTIIPSPLYFLGFLLFFSHELEKNLFLPRV